MEKLFPVVRETTKLLPDGTFKKHGQLVGRFSETQVMVMVLDSIKRRGIELAEICQIVSVKRDVYAQLVS